MSYTTKVRYRNRRERLKKHGQNLKWIVIFAILISLVLIIRNRYDIYQYIKTYFY